jgi:hypothetical protein
VEGNCVYFHRVDGRTGAVTQTQISNFDARIAEEVVFDDGSGEVARVFYLTGTHQNGRRLSKARVGALEFGAMTWIPREWGAGAVVRAGFGHREQLREAIQTLSDPARQVIYQHTGWREVDGEWVFLFHGGAIGADDVTVDLDRALNRYALPDLAEDVQEAVQMSLGFLDCGPRIVTVPILCATYLAPLAHHLGPDFVVWLVGVTGSLKSELAALAQRHFGRFDRKHLPCSWTSTENAIEGRLFHAKDVVCVVDDYAPRGDRWSQTAMERSAQRIVRSVGNQSSRGRLRSDLTHRPDRPPRGVIFATGEDLPPTSSIQARLVVVAVEKQQLDLAVVTEMQRSGDRLAQAMAGYISWLRPRFSDLAPELQAKFRDARGRFQGATGHMRQPEALAQLYLGMDMASQYFHEIGAITASEAEELRQATLATLDQVGKQQAEILEAADPAEIFMETLRDAFVQDRAVLVAPSVATTGGAVGWADDEYVYLLPGAVQRLVFTARRDLGLHWPFSQRALGEALLQAGFILEGPKRPYTWQRRLGGARPRVYMMPLHLVEESLAVHPLHAPDWYNDPRPDRTNNGGRDASSPLSPFSDT